MKKLFFVLTLALFASATQVNAQNEDYRSAASLSVGQSFIGIGLKALGSDTLLTNGNASVNVSPAIELAYDYSLKKWFSIGLAATYQNFGFDVEDYTYFNANGDEIVESFKAGASRTAISIRPLFHYGNSDKLDMYSGLRIGTSIWNVKSNSTDPDFEDIGDLNGTGASLHVSLVTFGLRYHFTDNIGAGFELHLGTPYLAKIGVTSRF